MQDKVKIGIIICDRYRTCAGGKCFRAAREKEGAFSVYKDREVEVVGFTTCAGCPGGNVEYAVDEMKKNGATAIHLATGLVVGYPPCPSIGYFRDFIRAKYGLDVVYGRTRSRRNTPRARSSGNVANPAVGGDSSSRRWRTRRPACRTH